MRSQVRAVPHVKVISGHRLGPGSCTLMCVALHMRGLMGGAVRMPYWLQVDGLCVRHPQALCAQVACDIFCLLASNATLPSSSGMFHNVLKHPKLLAVQRVEFLA